MKKVYSVMFYDTEDGFVMVYVTAFSENSEFYWKIPSKKISYDAVMNILNGNLDAIKNTDIINITE